MSFFFCDAFQCSSVCAFCSETCLCLIRLGPALFAIGYHCPPLFEKKEDSLEVLIVSRSTILGHSDLS